MSMAITPPGGPGGFDPSARAVPKTNGETPVFSVDPTTPPIPEPVTTGVEKAAHQYEELRRQGRELHFRVADSGRVVVDVCDLDGNVVRTVPPETALDIIGGHEAA